MPSFLKQNDPSLSTLNVVKRKVVKKLKEQYRIAPDDIVAPAGADGEAPVGNPTPRIGKPVSGLASLLDEMETLVAEQVITSIQITDGALIALDADRYLPKPTDIIKDLAGNSSLLVNMVKKGAKILASASYDFKGKLTEPELDASISALNDFSAYMRRYDNEVRGRLMRTLQTNLSADERVEVLELLNALNTANSRWIIPLIGLHRDLVKALLVAKKSPAMRGGRMLGADGHGIRHVENVFGGALVQSYQSPPSGDRELLSCGYVSREPLVPLIQSYAPRNTMDLRGLPRYLM
jgi:hypothetical protein